MAETATSSGQSSLYAVNNNSPATLVAKTNWLTPVSISPDGNRYVYEDANYRSLLYTKAGVLLGSGSGSPATDDQYGWTSDSQFVYYGDYYDAIWEINTSSGNSRRVVVSEGAVFDHSVAVSADGKYLVWSHHEYGSNLTLFAVERAKLPLAAYQGAKVLWSGTSVNHDEQQGTVFINNKEFLFAITTSAPSNSTKLFLGNVETGAIQTLVVTDTSFGVGSLALSRDRTRVAYVLEDGSIFVLNVGEWKPNLIDKGLFFSTPVLTWSPDGRYLAVGLDDPQNRYNTPSTNKVYVHIYEVGTQNKWQVASVTGEKADGISWGP